MSSTSCGVARESRIRWCSKADNREHWRRLCPSIPRQATDPLCPKTFRSEWLLVVVPAHRVAAPRAPVPVVHLHRLGGHLLLVGEVLLEHVLAVGGVGVLVADIQADAHGGVGIDVEDPAVLDLAGEFVWRQALESGLALRRVGGQELEAGGRHHVFFAGDLLLRALAGGDGNAQSQRGKGCPKTNHPILLFNAWRAHVPVHFGARLPRKAAMPSRKSALP